MLMRKIKPILKIESHPFYLGPISPGININAPSSFPFYLGVHPKFAIPVLILTDEIRMALSNAYSLGSMLSTPLGKSSLSNERMFEVLNKLLSLFGGNVTNVKFLEIGCGTGALLNELQMRGAKVMGVEIGPQGQEGAKKHGFKVVDKPLESGIIKEQFDCIYSYACIEHITELEKFFSVSINLLKENGLFFHVVPNSEYQFNLGYLDHLVHEHVNYFTPKNGVRLFNCLGFRSAQACTTKAGNELFLWGYYDRTATLTWPGENIQFIDEESEKLKEYSNKLIKSTKRIVSALEKMQSKNQSIGFYAGGFEYSIFLKVLSNIRYFDGDSYKHGMSWLPGLPSIESPLALKKNPVDNLIICKDHYFDAIIKHLVEKINIPDNIQIYKLYDLARGKE